MWVRADHLPGPHEPQGPLTSHLWIPKDSPRVLGLEVWPSLQPMGIRVKGGGGVLFLGGAGTQGEDFGGKEMSGKEVTGPVSLCPVVSSLDREESGCLRAQ